MGSGSASGAERMREWVYGLPGQLAEAMKEAAGRGWPLPEPEARAIYLGGMGGSAMACLLARSILGGSLRVPCVVHQDPEVPAWVGSDTRAGIVSYSGETWEARRMLAECRSRGARVFVVASGGRILDDPAVDTRLRFPIPPGFAPRAALGWMLVPVLLALAGGEAGEVGEGLREAIALLADEVALWRAGRALPGRDPRELAAALTDRLGFIYAPAEPLRPVALRWKNQILENGKQAAAEAFFPELVHNEIMGWDFAARRRAAFIVLEDSRSSGGEAGAIVREAALRELAAAGAVLQRVPGRGESAAARCLTHVALADATSVELAVRRGIDPLPIAAIERVKKACGKELFG